MTELLRKYGGLVMRLGMGAAGLLIWLLEVGLLCVCKLRNCGSLFGALIPPDWLSKFEGEFLK
jgi:hypothetical protein